MDEVHHTVRLIPPDGTEQHVKRTAAVCPLRFQLRHTAIQLIEDAGGNLIALFRDHIKHLAGSRICTIENGVDDVGGDKDGNGGVKRTLQTLIGNGRDGHNHDVHHKHQTAHGEIPKMPSKQPRYQVSAACGGAAQENQ